MEKAGGVVSGRRELELPGLGFFLVIDDRLPHSEATFIDPGSHRIVGRIIGLSSSRGQALGDWIERAGALLKRPAGEAAQ